MKKTIIYAAATVFFMLALVVTVNAQEDLIREGKQVIEKSKLLMNEGQMVKNIKTPDRAWLVDEGHMLIKQGMDAGGAGEMMSTDHGRANMEEISTKLRQSGGALLKMGRQKGELTQQERDILKKEGDKMIELGTLLLEKGKFMAGE